MNIRQLTHRKYVRGTLAVLGAIIIGAVGSGVWEGLLKPGLTSSRDSILNIISFGIEGFKNAAYVEIAKGLHEGVSVELLSRFTFLFGALALLYILHILDNLADAKLKREKQMNEVNDLIQRVENISEKKENTESPEEIKKSLLEMRQSMESDTLLGLRISSYGLIFWIIVIASFAIVEATRTSYVNSAVTHFQQVYNIASPYMDEDKKAKILASFAQIKKRDDYVSIVEELENVAQSNGQTVPKFGAW